MIDERVRPAMGKLHLKWLLAC